MINGGFIPFNEIRLRKKEKVERIKEINLVDKDQEEKADSLRKDGGGWEFI